MRYIGVIQGFAQFLAGPFKGLQESPILISRVISTCMSTVTALLEKQLRSDEGTLDFLIMRPTVLIKNILADFEGPRFLKTYFLIPKI